MSNEDRKIEKKSPVEVTDEDREEVEMFYKASDVYGDEVELYESTPTPPPAPNSKEASGDEETQDVDEEFCEDCEKDPCECPEEPQEASSKVEEGSDEGEGSGSYAEDNYVTRRNIRGGQDHITTEDMKARVRKMERKFSSKYF